MAPAAAPAPQTVLLDTMGITELCAEKHTAIATACTSTGREVEFWLEEVTVSDRINLLQLHTSSLETPDPYGGRAIQHFPEVVCSHDGLVVLRLISPHKNFPTDYFVYGHLHDDDQQGRPWVIRLPMMNPGIYSSNSVGILRAGGAGDHYVVANLRLQVNPSQALEMQAFLDRYWSTDMKWSQQRVKVKPSSFNEEEDEEQELLRAWQTDLVLPCGNNSCLVWVDLLQGILLSPSLLSSSCTVLEYVCLPRNMPSAAARPAEGDQQQRGRPRQFRSIGCCADDGELKLKLVNIHRSNRYSVEVGIWTLNLQARRRSWRKEPARSLNQSLWWSRTLQAGSGSDSLPPLFPALSRDGRNRRDVLYLTVAGENKAHLLQIDTNTWTLIESSSYPRLLDHRNPPYPHRIIQASAQSREGPKKDPR